MEVIDSPKNTTTTNVEHSVEAQPSSQKETSEEVDSSKNGPTSDTNVESQTQPSPAIPSSVTEASSLPESSVEATSVSTNGPVSKKQKVDYNSMTTGVYLDSTVVPILHGALVTLDRLRPADPVQFVIDFLLRHKAQYSKSKEQPVSATSANQA